VSRRALLAIGLPLAVLLAAAALRLLIGPAGLAPPADEIAWRLRSARVLGGAAVGGGLAVAGVMLQALLRNPLAAPSVLGLTSGAGLGVALSMYLAYLATGAIVQHRPPAAAAFAGSIVALAVVYTLGQRRGLIEPVSLILTGVVVSLICGAGVTFIQHLMPDTGVAMTTRWLFGSLTDELTVEWLAVATGLVLIGAGVGVWLGPAMDAASLGEDEARSVGVPLGAIRMSLFLTAGALTTISVLIAGPIAFVGLVCPHLVRLLAGPSHRQLLVGAGLTGAALIIAADALVRALDFGAGRMPIGVLTALLGGPFFLWLLRRQWGGRP